MNKVKHFIQKIISSFFKQETPTRDTLQHLLKDEEGQGCLNNEERLLIKNILKLKDQTIGDIMVPRVDIVSVPVDISLMELATFVLKQPYTRIMVHGKDLDDILGFVHIKNLMNVLKTDKAFDLKDHLQKPLIVPQSLTIIDLLATMRHTQIPLALVVDAFGGVDGLVTAWTITTKVLGDIEKSEDYQTHPIILPLIDGSYEVDARLPVQDFCDMFGIILTPEQQEDDIETLGGFIVSMIGRVPDRKEIVSHPLLDFIILEANPRRIERVQIKRKKEI